MPTLTRRDRLLLWALVPIYAICLTLHVQEVARSGLAQLPVWVYAGSDGYPVVGGYRVETDSEESGLQPGDRLLRVGDRDLAGQGYIGFDAQALAATGPRGEAALVFERDGVRHVGSIHPRPRSYPWTRVPPLVLGCLISILVLLRAPDQPDARRFFAAIMTYGIVQSQFYGGPAWRTWASLLIWNFGTPVSLFLMLRWATLFPAEVAASARPWRGWAWLGAGCWLPVRLSYFFGAPIPPHLVPSLFQALHGLLMIGTVALLVRNYAHADPVGRRRLKWVLAGAVIGSFPLATSQIALLLDPSWPGFQVAFAWGTAATSIALICLLVAIARYNVFDIDRLLTETASYTLVGAVFLGTALFVVPAAGDRAAHALGVRDGPVRAVFGVALAGGLLLAHRRLRPWIDHSFFPERLLREQGIDQLLRDLAQCADREEVLELVGERLRGVLGAERCLVYAPRDGRLEAQVVRGEGATPPFPDRGPLALALERNPAPLAVGEIDVGRLVPDLTPAEAGALEALHGAVLLPLRCGKDLAAFVVLAPHRSGDVYTRTELTLLGAVGERASSALLHLRDAETIRHERVRADELARLRGEAEDALRRRSRFLAAASHDLRQPLHALRMYASLLGERDPDDGTRELAVRIERSAESLSEMFASLLDVSRLDTGAVEPRVSGFALDPLLEELVGELSPAAEARGLKLRWLRSDLAVRSDPVLLGRILRNLLGNAIRYTDEGEVRLLARARDGSVEIDVADTGPGIPAGRRREIFREFVRLDPEDERGGLGLGLAIVERLVTTLGHEIELDSEPGRGSTFRLRLRAAAPPRPGDPIPGTALAGRLVLLVDDDLAVLRATREVLTAWGCRVVAAASSADALDAIEQRGVPDVILADYRLRDRRTGIEAIASVREAADRPVPAVVLTGETGEGVLDALRASGLAYLTKPVAPARLRALLAELLRR